MINKYRGIVLFGILLFVLGAPPVTWSEIFNVANVTDFQDALTTASTNGQNDTINVGPGTYNISTTLNYNSFENFSLTVSGAGAGTTILDGGNTTQLLNISSTGPNADINVRGMTFRNGNNTSTDFGGGLSIAVESAVIIIELSVFNANRANRTAPTSGNGGGVYAGSDSGSVILRNNAFTGNSATNDGGGASVWTTNGTILIADNTFTNNTTETTGGDDGGGVAAVSDNGQITITRNAFNNNSSGDSGGAAFAYLNVPGGVININNNTFTNNAAGLDGGGSFTRSNAIGTTITILNNTFTGNSAATTGGGSLLHLQGGSANITKNTYNNNTCPVVGADSDGAGIWAWTGSASLTLTGNVFKSNNASRNGGGADLSTDSGTISLVNNTLNSNVAGNVGGGISIAAVTGTLSLTNNTLYNNSAADGGGVNFYSETPGTTLNIYNTIIWNSTPQAILQSGAGPVMASYSDIQVGTGQPWFGAGCLDADPLFAAPVSGNFHLKSGSPCIDAGDGTRAPVFDFEGNRRWDDPAVANTGIGPPWADMGIDERISMVASWFMLLLGD